MMIFPGYYVEGRHYGTRWAQALARAKFLANLYGRSIDILLNTNADVSVERVVIPH